ncbi:MAG: hypothetical protein ACR2RE_14600 [Geminicoccaceae bacterium]
MAWMLHHVNLPALKVHETKAFLRDLIGLKEGRWIYPETQGELHHDEDSIAHFGTENRGLHVVRQVPSFAHNNGFMHNPTIGGHFAISVPDLNAVKGKLDDAGVLYSDAGVYAMAGVHQIYVYDPSFNLIEVNQTVEPLAPTTRAEQPPDAEIHIRQAAIPAQDVDASASFFHDLIGGDNAPRVDKNGAVFRSGDHAIRLTRLTSGFERDEAAAPADREPYFTLAVSDLNAVKTRLDRAAIPNSGLVKEPVDSTESLFVHAPSMRLMALIKG